MSTLNTGTLSGTVSTAGVLTGMLSISTDYRPALMQEKTVTPADVAQVITPDTGYGGLSTVTVNAIPSNYGKITYDGVKILVE